MKITIEIELGNEAMQTFDDVATAVQDCANSLSDSTGILCDGEAAKLWDSNGNTVGKWEVSR
jgi:hypothetical protein